MTTDELINELYKMDFIGGCDDFPVMDVFDSEGDIIASVDILNFGVLDTTFSPFAWLKDDEKQKLLGMLFLYANTPLDERLDEDGY